MCEALRELMKDEIEAEKQENVLEAMLGAIKSLIATTGVTPEQAMSNLGIAVADRGKYAARL